MLTVAMVERRASDGSTRALRRRLSADSTNISLAEKAAPHPPANHHPVIGDNERRATPKIRRDAVKHAKRADTVRAPPAACSSSLLYPRTFF